MSVLNLYAYLRKRCATPEGRAKFGDRLLRNISREAHANGCLEWKARVTAKGYPRLNIRVEGRHVTVYAHRVMWTLHNQRTPPSHLEVHHTCDNPRCVNPSHLELRTPKFNTRAQARCRKGE
jgi:hypothetical protein